MNFYLLKNFFKNIGLKKIGYGYESFSPGSERKIIDLSFKSTFLDGAKFSFIPLICYEIIYSGEISTKSQKTNFNKYFRRWLVWRYHWTTSTFFA